MKKLLLSITMLFACVALFAAKPANWEKNVINGIVNGAKEAGEVTEEQRVQLTELYAANVDDLWNDDREVKVKANQAINAGLRKILTPEQFKAYQASKAKK